MTQFQFLSSALWWLLSTKPLVFFGIFALTYLIFFCLVLYIIILVLFLRKLLQIFLT